MVKDVKWESPENRYWGSEVILMPSAIVTFASKVQPEKAALLIVVTDDGMLMEVNLLQFWNALSEMVSIPSDIVMFSNSVQL